MAQDIYIDVNYLTESERDAILQVLAKDEDLRKQEKRRISKLKNELDEIKSRGASEEEIKFSRVCARCRSPFGLVFNTGALCPRCEARVCKECRTDNSSKWLCILCAKIREVRAESGAWFFEQEKKKSDRPQLYGSALVRASFRRAKLPSYGSHKDFDPGSPPVITQMNLQGRVGGLRRPVAVRMSQLAEKQSEEVNEQTNSEEVNQNYKQYIKATPVAKTVEEVESDDQGRDSFSSCSSTPRAGADNVGGVTATQPETTFETAVVDDGAKPGEGHGRPIPDDDTDSIDRAFASYERDNPNGSVKTLKDQLNILSMGSRESIVSYYSEAGEGRFGNVVVKGEVLFGIKYDKRKNQLEVQIHRAKDIAAADEKKGRSDPYVKVYLLPDKTKGGKRKTKTKRNTLEPDFDEILRFKIGFDEMLTRTLWLTMWNHDTFGHNDFLGEVMLPLDTYQESGFSWDDPSPNWYPLRERRSEPSLMTYCGDLTVSLKFEPGQESLKDKKKKKKLGGRLHIKLREARNLPAKDANGFSDPFVKRPLPKLFDKKASEPEESKIEAGETVEKTKVSQEPVLLTSESRSHENLAFEEEEQHTEAKDISMDSSTAVATTLEATTREENQEVKQAEESGNDSGISESHLNGSDITKVDDTKTGLNGVEKEEPTRDMQPALKSIGSLAIGIASFSPPEIKVDKPKTLFSVAEGKSSSTDASPQSSRRKTDTEIKRKTLSPFADTRRRHSDFVSAPISINEELAREDLKKRGFNLVNKKDETVRKGSVPEVVSSSRGPQWSPRLERKKQDDAKKTKKKEERRKTLAELALEAGYSVKVEESPADTQVPNQTIEVKNQTNEDENKKSEENHERILSEHGHEHYSGIPVTGELYVSLRYDMQSTKFEVQIHSANNLACANPKSGSSDPYVKTYLLPDKRSKRKTKTKNDTLNPKYDEILEYVIGYDELLTRTLQMSVWHKVIGRNDFLGEVRIPMNEFIESCGNSLQQSISKWFTLSDQSDVTDGLPSVPCELVLALKYVTADKIKLKKGRKKGELQVHLLEARNLPGMDYDGMSDPYCKCYLLPDKKGKWKNKSPVIKRTLNPTFNHKFSYEELSLDDLKEKVLEIVIYDFDLASSDEFLGGVRLGLGTSSNEWDDATEDECQIWQTMLSRSNVWIQVVIPLRSSMVSMKNVSGQVP
ncbi:synaptotagmin-like protein 2 isoform X2 [Montipora foliosa]|uniref:synaptotagmin-like protein 2 isoform X2 n=1 Tax=Montipora foliosa TaxID=591990 RepID=UPI0035F18627